MAEYSSSMLKDEVLSDEIVAYKPLSPMATLSLIAGVAAVIAAMSVWNIRWGFVAVPIIAFLLGLKGLSSVKRYDMAGKGAAKMALVLSALSIIAGSGAIVYIDKYTVPPGYLEISYDPLQADGSPVPQKAQALDGKKVYIQGYMYPTNRIRNLTGFILCRDNGTCCFGGQPKLNDMVEVKVKQGLSLDFTSSLRGIGGTLRVKPEKDPGGLGTVLYHIEDADVIH